MKIFYLLLLAFLLPDITVAQSVSATKSFSSGAEVPSVVIAGTIALNCGDGASFLPKMRLTIADGSDNTTLFTDGSGQYDMRTAPSTDVKVIPELENNYFTVIPASYHLEAAPAGTAFQADFCLLPNGIHPDVQIEIIPLDHARAGLNAHYKLIYSNKGTVQISGGIALEYPGRSVAVIGSTPPVATNSENVLTWAFEMLQPFESREIVVAFNIDPSATAIGPTLPFTAAIHPDAPDETPQDNTKSLVQPIVFTVVPNDKLVAQGAYISTGQLDEFLNYTIRFQNTGNYLVQNVVINDFIQTSLDVATLQTTTASHPYRATLKNNKLEIIFENINLPPASENELASHGFATFKVKPKTSVALGDVIENTAEIYFDLNMPVVTNTVTTTVMETLARSAFSGSGFSIYPNPTADLLHVASRTPIDSVSIFNPLGQMVLHTKNTTIDATGWASGFYLIKVSTSGQTTTKKFLKL